MQSKLENILQQLNPEKLQPLDDWQPQNAGEIDIVIKADGSWWHEGGKIERQALVNLFASILICENGQHYLKTPVEKLAISVEDAPLLITQWTQQQDKLLLTTNTGEHYPLSEEFPLLYRQGSEEHIPYLQLRHNLLAKIHRNVFYQLAELAIERGDRVYLQSGEYQAVLT